MSTIAYAAITPARGAPRPGISKTSGSRGVQTYVDTLAALVPAEILAAHAAILTVTTKTTDKTVVITEPGALGLAFYCLIVLSLFLYIASRAMMRKWERLDFLRMLIPPLAFIGWTMLQKATAFDAVVSPESLSEAKRVVIAIIGGLALAGIAALLAYRAGNSGATLTPLVPAANPQPPAFASHTGVVGESSPAASRSGAGTDKP
jgi:hypothetical protein